MFRLDSQKLEWERTPGGLLKAFVTLGKANKPLDYWTYDGEKFGRRREMISLDQLRDEASLATAYGSPITLGHPSNKRFDGNAEGLMIGSLMQEVIVDEEEGTVCVAGTITDQRGDRLIKKAAEEFGGLFPEMSPAYEVGKFQADGSNIIWQFNRAYDHNALLLPTEGRGDQDIRLRLDSKDAVIIDLAPTGNAHRNFWGNSIPSGKPLNVDHKTTPLPMKSIQVKDRIYNIDSNSPDLAGLANAVSALQTEFSQLKDSATASEAKVTTLTGELATANQRADSAATALSTAEGKIAGLEDKIKTSDSFKADSNAIAAERKETLEAMMLTLPTLRADSKEFEIDYGWSADDWRRAYIAKAKPGINLDGKDAAYVNAFWDAIKSDIPTTQNADSVNALETLLNMQSASGPAGGTGGTDESMSKQRSRIEANGMKSVATT